MDLTAYLFPECRKPGRRIDRHTVAAKLDVESFAPNSLGRVSLLHDLAAKCASRTHSSDRLAREHDLTDDTVGAWNSAGQFAWPKVGAGSVVPAGQMTIATA